MGKNGYDLDVRMGNYAYKIEQLEAMLKCEQSDNDQAGYGAHITHWSGSAKAINLDAGAIQALIDYYTEAMQ